MSEQQDWKQDGMPIHGRHREHLPKVGRQQARERGQKWYWTGVPCIRGHVAYRLVSNTKCSRCGKEDKSRSANKKEYGTSVVRKIDDLKLAREIAKLERGDAS